MKQLTDIELQNIYGGAISANMINYIVRGFDFILEIGRSLGTAIRRIGENKICPLE